MTAHALARLEHCVKEAQEELGQIRISGSISEVTPAYARVVGLSRFLKLGECVSFQTDGVTQLAEVVRIDEQMATVKTFDVMALARLGERVHCAGALRIFPDQSWKGRVINALGVPIDSAGPLRLGEKVAKLDAPPPPAMRRARVRKPLKTGVRVLDLFTPICAGQRIGIFAGSGVGKSTLLAMLAGSLDFDTVVIALVGERGREVREFLDDALAVKPFGHGRRGGDRG